MAEGRLLSDCRKPVESVENLSKEEQARLCNAGRGISYSDLSEAAKEGLTGWWEMEEPFELPPHQWIHIVGSSPDGKNVYPSVQWWACTECHKAGPHGVGVDNPPEPGHCWGKRPIPEWAKRAAAWICRKDDGYEP